MDEVELSDITYDEWLRAIGNIEDQRPSCPHCESLHVVSQGSNWHCMDCGTYFVKKWKKKSVEVPVDIICPDCGADYTHIQSKGPDWRCKKCGRLFKKNPRRKVMTGIKQVGMNTTKGKARALSLV